MIQVKEIVIVGGFDDQRRGARAIIRRGMFDMARTWHRKFVPAHFTDRGSFRYNYAERGEFYEKQKARRGKEALVWSGRTKAQAKTMFHVTGSATRVRGKFFLPSYIRMKKSPHYFKGKRCGDLPAMGLELVTTTKRERVFLAKRLRRQVIAGLGAIKTRKVVRV